MSDAQEVKRAYFGEDQLGREAVAIRYDDGDVTIALGEDPVNDPEEAVVLSATQFNKLTRF